MSIQKLLLSSNTAIIALFVTLWGSAAIFSRWGLDHTSVFVFLTLRYAIALIALSFLALKSKTWLPEKGTRLYVLITGSLLIGAYSICYFQALRYGVTPGLLATLLGIQPILTLLISERRFTATRACGLLIAFAGLILIVSKSMSIQGLEIMGLVYAFVSLLAITIGTLMQKKINQAPHQILPLQYSITLIMCLAFLPSESLKLSLNIDSWVPIIWLGLGISVIAQLLLYRLIRTGNLVNITSLFYLIPVVTVILDYLFLGNTMSLLSIAGMAAIILGVMLVFKQKT